MIAELLQNIETQRLEIERLEREKNELKRLNDDLLRQRRPSHPHINTDLEDARKEIIKLNEEKGLLDRMVNVSDLINNVNNNNNYYTADRIRREM
jgi:chromosome segregation ATPase